MPRIALEMIDTFNEASYRQKDLCMSSTNTRFEGSDQHLVPPNVYYGTCNKTPRASIDPYCTP